MLLTKFGIYDPPSLACVSGGQCYLIHLTKNFLTKNFLHLTIHVLYVVDEQRIRTVPLKA